LLKKQLYVTDLSHVRPQRNGLTAGFFNVRHGGFRRFLIVAIVDRHRRLHGAQLKRDGLADAP
jgi:hypothetical protein